MVCLDPGFSKTSAEKYGYHVSLYWAGLRTPDLSFIGWNGKENESRSSREILEEMFLLPGNQSIVKAVAYTDNYDKKKVLQSGFFVWKHPVSFMYRTPQ